MSELRAFYPTAWEHGDLYFDRGGDGRSCWAFEQVGHTDVTFCAESPSAAWRIAIATLGDSGWEMAGIAVWDNQTAPTEYERNLFFFKRAVLATTQLLPTVKLTPTSVHVGDSVAIVLRSYEPLETIRLVWYGGALSTGIELTTTSSDLLGTANTSFLAPPVPKGTYWVVTIDQQEGSAPPIQVTVEEHLVLNPPRAPVGTPLALTVSGFGAAEEVDLVWVGSSPIVSPLTTDAHGSASVSGINAPAAPFFRIARASGKSSGALAHALFRNA